MARSGKETTRILKPNLKEGGVRILEKRRRPQDLLGTSPQVKRQSDRPMPRENVTRAKSIPAQKTSREGVDNGNINASLRSNGGGTAGVCSRSPPNSIPPATRQQGRAQRTHEAER